MKERKKWLIAWVCLVVVLLAASILAPGGVRSESIQETMRDAVLHDTGRISFFGLKDVNPGFVSAVTVSAALLVLAACIRIFAVPRFKMRPGRFQLLLEELVSLFDNMAKSYSPHRNGFLGAYIFGAGVYIFVSTFFELFGVQAATTSGVTITLPAPLSDVNAAIAMGCLSYLVILSGGIAQNGLRGVGSTLKELSLIHI